MEDTRNLIDAYKGKTIEEIVSDLDTDAIELEIAIENLERDFNMGTIVRSANAFGVRKVHIIGSKQWNKRGAMMTDKYLHIEYHADVEEFLQATTSKEIIAVDNIAGAELLSETALPQNALLVFGAEKDGLSPLMVSRCTKTIAIEQFGSTRSINVGVAAGIVMYAWLQQNVLS